MRRYSALIAGAAMLLASTNGPAATGKPHDESWGKTGISFEQYRADTLTCSNTAYGVPVHMDSRTVTALGEVNSATLETVTAGVVAAQGDPGAKQAALAATVEPSKVIVRSSDYQDLYDHAARQDVVAQLQAVVDRCLTAHGYRRFRLTDGQMHRLDRLKKGTEERARYLYSLGTDPKVLAAQAA